MKIAFDTSVLVAGSVAGHIHEARAAIWLNAAREGRIDAIASLHAFGETWATLTAIPIEPRLSPKVADEVVLRLSRHVEPVALRWSDYRAAMRRCGERTLRSGALYDALHLVAAERLAASALLTFDVRHFTRLSRGPDPPRIAAPPDPPGFGDLLSSF